MSYQVVSHILRGNLLAFILLLSIISACRQSNPYQKEIKEVDSLRTEVEKLEVTMKKVNHDRVMQVKDTVYFVMNETIKLMQNDSNRNHWIAQMAQLEQVARAFQKYEGSANQLTEQVNLSRKQLETLRNSLEDKKLDSAEVQNYLNDERLMMRTVSYDVNRRFPAVVNALQIWDSIKPAYDTLWQNATLSPVSVPDDE